MPTRGRKPTPPAVVAEIENLYADLIVQLGQKPSVDRLIVELEVRAAAEGRSALDYPSPRTIGRIVAAIRERGGDVAAAQDGPLTPWQSPEWLTHDAEAIACLYRLLRISASIYHIGLTRRQAKWATRLRAMFVQVPGEKTEDVGLVHIVYAKMFARKERIGELLGMPAHFADLDALLQYRTWESEANLVAYREAVANGLIPGRTSADMVSEFEITNPKAVELTRQSAQDLEPQEQEAAK